MLSTILPGCARPVLETLPAPPPVVVRIKDTPPAELTRCPTRPEGFPEDTVAVMPAPVRDAVIRLARAFATATSRLERLIEWTRPGACKAASSKPSDAQAAKR